MKCRISKFGSLIYLICSAAIGQQCDEPRTTLWKQNIVRLSEPIDRNVWGSFLSPSSPWVVAGDVDGDGCDDLVVSAIDCVIGDCVETAGTGQIYHRRAVVQVISGSTGDLVREWVDPEPPDIGAPPISAPFGYRGGMSVADVDGDGCADVAIASPWRDVDLTGDGLREQRVGVVYVLSGSSGDLIYTLQGHMPNARFGWTLSFVGDWNNDGAPELLITDAYAIAGGAYVFSGRTGEVLGDAMGGVFGQYGVVRVYNVGDVSGDGANDALCALTSSIGGTIDRYVVISSHDFDAIVTITDLFAGSLSTRASAVGDVDNDGHADIALVQEQGIEQHVLRLYSGQSGQMFHSLVIGPIAPAGYAAISSVGDVKGDAILDLAVGPSVVAPNGETPTEGVQVISLVDGRCLEQWQTATRAWKDWTGPSPVLANAFSSMVSGDFDGDGNPDIASVGVLENQIEPPYYLYQINIFRRPGCPEDMTGDGFVGFADLSEFLDTFNDIDSPGALPADIDGNGHVDFGDLNLILAAFNSGC